ncbi:MAG: MAPEG family protein [Moraxellaceae bacterium]|nr:MAPEG family protein [Pseudobdellovibrionaceae bacterium]
MNINITLIYAAILAAIYVGLSIRVIKHRFGTKTLFGDAGHHDLSIAVRTHGNFAEYVPFCLILIMGVELRDYSALTIHILGTVLIVARLSHVFGLKANKGAGLGRPLGVIATLLLMVTSSVLILIRSF